MENFKDKIEEIDINNVTASDVTVIENVIQLLDNGKIRVAEPIKMTGSLMNGSKLRFFITSQLKT